MKKLSEVFESNHHDLENLAYSNSKGKTYGKRDAEIAKETLQEELDFAKPILESVSLETSTKQDIEFEIRKLEICLENLDTSRSTNDRPLNIVLRDYFCDKRKELQECFFKLDI